MILKLHAILMNAIQSDAGTYRKHGVRILGTFVPTANFLKIPDLMGKLTREINHKTADVIAHVCDIHAQFEQIHPFSDGNGRVGRLIMHAMALQSNLPPVTVSQEKRRQYMTYLNKAQIKKDSTLLQDFICDALLGGYRIVERE